MQYLVLAFCVLVGAALLYRWFVTADPAAIRKSLLWIGGLLIGALVILFLVRGGASALWWLGLVGVPMLLRWRNVLNTVRNVAKAARGPSPGQTSSVRTDWIVMTLDHDSGGMSGEVLKGPFAGRSLSELTRDELLDLLSDCAADDPQSVQLVESFMDRAYGPEWRTDASGHGGAREGQSGAGAAADAGTMTRSQALDVLGLEESATEQEIRDAHRRLMMANHPDRGGSPFLATQINRAKDVLLGKA